MSTNARLKAVSISLWDFAREVANLLGTQALGDITYPVENRTKRSLCRIVVCLTAVSIRCHNGKPKGWRGRKRDIPIGIPAPPPQLNLCPNTTRNVTVYVRNYLRIASRPQPQGEVGVMPPRGSAETDRAMWSRLGCSRVRRWL